MMDQVSYFQRMHCNDIAIMEDNTEARNEIKEILSEIGYSVHIVKTPAEAVELATKKKVRNFILDINMGSKREQAGLDALERIKKADSEIFVAILSAYRTKYMEMASKLHADYFKEKTSDRRADTLRIHFELLHHLRDILDHEISDMEGLYDIGGDNDDIEDVNFAKYTTLLQDAAWYKENRDMYVAIVNGDVVKIDSKCEQIMSDVQKQFPDVPKFITRINGDNDEIDIGTPLEID